MRTDAEGESEQVQLEADSRSQNLLQVCCVTRSQPQQHDGHA